MRTNTHKALVMEDDDANLDNEIRSLLAAGRKIEAIKRFRQATGAGLAEAKEAVEEIEWDAPLIPNMPGDPGLELEIVSLLGRGQKIQAVKLYRERAGTGLKEAKEAVEAIGSKHGISGPSGTGCLGLLIYLAVVMTCITVVLAAAWF